MWTSVTWTHIFGGLRWTFVLVLSLLLMEKQEKTGGRREHGDPRV